MCPSRRERMRTTVCDCRTAGALLRRCFKARGECLEKSYDGMRKDKLRLPDRAERFQIYYLVVQKVKRFVISQVVLSMRL